MPDFLELLKNTGKLAALIYANAAAAEERKGLTLFEIKSLTTSDIVFYIGVAVITISIVALLIWRTMKLYRESFKNTDLPVETIKLHVKTEEEKQNEKKYEEEVEAFLKKKRYIKGRK